jgi:hypothetical protein
MRVRLGLLAAMLMATLISPLTPNAIAFGGFASAPTSVTQTAIAGGIRVTWGNPTDVDTGITGYKVEYSTSGTSGTWTLKTTTSSSTYSYDIVGLSQIATYVRVAATTSAGTGAYGYPWTKLYGTTSLNRNASNLINYETGFGAGASDPYNSLASAEFSRVRYRMEATLPGGSYYSETDFYKWSNSNTSGLTTSQSASPSVRNLIIPSISGSYTQTIHANVSDLNIFSNNPNVENGTVTSGRLEIWPWDYGTARSGLSTPGDASSYDMDDTPSTPTLGSYGSFQVHNLSSSKVVWVWNHHDYGVHPEVGFGTSSTGNPDWTFCNTTVCPLPTAFKLQIFVNIPVIPLADTTAPTVSRIDSRIIAKNGDTITVQSNEAGTAYLVNQSVVVSSFANITAASASNKNSVSISAASTNTTLTLSSLNDGLYNLYAADSFNNLSSAILATIRVDNTAPTASSITVNSAGTAIILTASETITNSAQVVGLYSVSDSGSALSISATSFSGSVATLTLSRSIPAGAYVTFSYSPASGAAGGRWIDQAGNEMAAITTRTITNNSSSPISVSLSVPDPLSKGVSATVSVAVSVSGKVTFLLAGKRVSGCINKSASGSTPITVTCTFKPALAARQTIRATLVPTLNAYPTTSASVERFILKRTTRR